MLNKVQLPDQKLKKTISHKPDSVIPGFTRNGYHLSSLCIAAKIHLPTLPDSRETFCRAGKRSGFTWHFST